MAVVFRRSWLRSSKLFFFTTKGEVVRPVLTLITVDAAFFLSLAFFLLYIYTYT